MEVATVSTQGPYSYYLSTTATLYGIHEVRVKWQIYVVQGKAECYIC